MLIWGAVIIPVLTAIVLLKFFKKNIVWWEVLLPMAVSIVLIFAVKSAAEYSEIADVEYWGGYVTHSDYSQAWDERVSCRHPKYCTRSKTCYSTDSKGRSRSYSCSETYQCGYYHLYDVDYHPEQWDVFDSNGRTFSVSKSYFENLAKLWGNRVFVDMHRNFHSIDGDVYRATWDNIDAHLDPTVTQHTYENKIKVSKSVFHFQDIDPKVTPVLEYPAIGGYHQDELLGDGGPTTADARRRIAIWNAKLGASKQVKIFFIVYKDKPRQAAMEQESYWQGGNKNEFIVTIGLDKENKVQWSQVISWTEVDTLKIAARNKVMEYMNKPINLVEIADYTGEAVQKTFKRKNFKDFDYLTVEPPMWGYITAYLLTLFLCIGIAVWEVKNGIDDEPTNRNGRWNR